MIQKKTISVYSLLPEKIKFLSLPSLPPISSKNTPFISAKNSPNGQKWLEDVAVDILTLPKEADQISPLSIRFYKKYFKISNTSLRLQKP
jgi:hypothetical protein